MYFYLQKEYSEVLSEVANEYNHLLKEASAKTLLLIKDNSHVWSEIEKFFKTAVTDNKLSEENIDIDEEIEEEEISDELIDIDIQEMLFQNIRKIVRKKAIAKYDFTVRLTEKERKIEELISPVFKFVDSKDDDRIGQLSFLIKYFGKSTRGVETK